MSLNLPTLQALLSRVEGGEGEDRALDAEIALHLGEAFCMMRWYSDAVWQFRWQDDCEWEPLPHFVTSLDAAVALVERRLPGCVLDVEGHAGATAPSVAARALCIRAPPPPQETRHDPAD
jgi:hypothetical protein